MTQTPMTDRVDRLSALLARFHIAVTVSHRYGYASSEALARAFQRQFGKAPLAARREA